MAEGSYEYECNRAELLGIDPPNKVDFEAAYKVRQEELEKEASNVSYTSVDKCFEDDCNLNLFWKDVETLDEQINNTSGKFDELNSILSVTQQRLNKFKVIWFVIVKVYNVYYTFSFRASVQCRFVRDGRNNRIHISMFCH